MCRSAGERVLLHLFFTPGKVNREHVFPKASLLYQQNGKCNVFVQMLLSAIPALQWEFNEKRSSSLTKCLCSAFGSNMQY